MSASTVLRPLRDGEGELVDRWDRDEPGEFMDFSGDPPPGAAPPERGPRPAGSGLLGVADGQDRLIGSVGWRPVLYGPNPGSQALDIGIVLCAAARGQGHGSRAQRMLADYLFATTGVHRVQASTDVDNRAEQRALERAGFTREGVLRQAQWRAGAYRDLVSYARLRTDP